MIHDHTDPRLTQTNLFFRLLYLFFTWIGLSAAVGLAMWLADGYNEMQFGFIMLVFGIPAYSLAEYVVRRYRLYRYGIEEALALLSMFFFCGGIILIILSTNWHPGERHMISIFAVITCAFAYWLYLRFGFIYAALISAGALCILPFQLSLSPLAERALLFSILWLLFLVSLRSESERMEDFRRIRKSIIQGVILAGIYLSINLRIFAVAESWIEQASSHLTPYAGFPPTAYWTSYVLTFLIPALGLFLGIKARKRFLLNAGLIALILTLATNKDYLGLKHYPWDPMVFGVTLILGAVLVIRWLAKGQNGERYGFTAENILKPEQYGLDLAEIGAAALPGITSTPVEATSANPSPFEGGQSGGGGASRSF